jgi:hypothetical protein
MTEQSVLGSTTTASVQLAPELALAMYPDSPGADRLPLNSPAANLGRTDTPVNVLPSLAFDMQPQTPPPSLALTVRVRRDAQALDVAFDLCRLFATINQLEVKLGGAGLMLHEGFLQEQANGRKRAVPTEQINAAVLLVPTEANDAAGRLARVIDALHDGLPGTDHVTIESLHVRSPGD